MDGTPVHLRVRIPVRCRGYHRPVCVETVVGPFHHFFGRGVGPTTTTGLKPACSLIRNYSIVGAILFSLILSQRLHCTYDTRGILVGNSLEYCAQLHHTLAALKRQFHVSLIAPLPNSEQINHPFSNHTQSRSQIPSTTTMPPL